MNYELNLSEKNEIILTIELQSGLTNVKLNLINHTGTVIQVTDYSLEDNVITYTIPFALYEIEGTFKYQVLANEYESEYIEVESSVVYAKNCCKQYKLSSGDYCICVKKKDNRPEVLWVNVNPKSEMGIETIILKNSDYDVLECIYNDNTNSGYFTNSTKAVKGSGFRLIACKNNQVAERQINRINDTTYESEHGLLSGAEQDRRCVPIYIIGYNIGLDLIE